MKKLLLAVLSLLPLTMSSQNFVGITDNLPWQWMPRDLSLGDHIYFYSYLNNSYNEFRVYTENLETLRDIKVEVPYTYDYKEEQKDGTGKWIVVSEETKRIDLSSFRYINCDSGLGSGNESPESLRATQALFSNDDKFEFYVKVPDETSVSINEYDSDGDGQVDRRTTSTGEKAKCFNVISEDGNVLTTINPPAGYKLNYLTRIMKMAGEIYLVFHVSSDSSTYGYAFYRVDKPSSSVKLVKTMPIKVSPTIASPSDMITVEFGDNPNVHEITVVNAAGQTVKQVPVASGQRSVSFSAQGLGRGLNILNAPSDGKNNACKIIIK